MLPSAADLSKAICTLQKYEGGRLWYRAHLEDGHYDFPVPTDAPELRAGCRSVVHALSMAVRGPWSDAGTAKSLDLCRKTLEATLDACELRSAMAGEFLAEMPGSSLIRWARKRLETDKDALR